MNYREFERLFNGDRIVFMMGMELFLENGRMAILEHSEEELGQAVGEKLTGFFAQEKVNAVVQAAKAFAQLKTTELLTYTSKCDVQIENTDVDIAGVCPVCGGPLLYGEDASKDENGAVGWTCQDCDATGKEIYRQVFDCHQDVRLGDGRPVPPREH